MANAVCKRPKLRDDSGGVWGHPSVEAYVRGVNRLKLESGIDHRVNPVDPRAFAPKKDVLEIRKGHNG
jgi:hypothetical protein